MQTLQWVFCMLKVKSLKKQVLEEKCQELVRTPEQVSRQETSCNLLHVFWTIAHVFVKWKVGAFTLE